MKVCSVGCPFTLSLIVIVFALLQTTIAAIESAPAVKADPQSPVANASPPKIKVCLYVGIEIRVIYIPKSVCVYIYVCVCVSLCVYLCV